MICRSGSGGVAGSRPGGRVTFFAPKKVTKEGRQRTLRRVLWNLREYLASTRRLPSLPTGTPAEGSIQVAGAPNDRSRIARGDPPSGKQRPFRAFARFARARRSRAVFRLPVGAACHAKAAAPPRKHPRYGSGGSPAEALRPRRGGGRDAVGSSANPWTGRRRLWPQANRRRRGGQGGTAPCGFFPPFLVRTRNGVAAGRLPASPPPLGREI